MWYVSSPLSYITTNNIELSFKSPNPRMLDFAYVSRLKNKNICECECGHHAKL